MYNPHCCRVVLLTSLWWLDVVTIGESKKTRPNFVFNFPRVTYLICHYHNILVLFTRGYFKRPRETKFHQGEKIEQSSTEC